MSPISNPRGPRGAALAVLVLAPLLGLLVTAPAQAQGLSRNDAAQDTWQHVEGDEYVAVDEIENIDLRRTELQHRRNRIWVRGTFADLRQHPRQGTWLSLGTWDGERTVYFQALAYVGPETRTGGFRLVRREVDAPESDRACAGARVAVDYRADTLTMSFPRGCVGNPELLRWQVESYSIRGIDTDNERTLTDDSVSQEARAQSWQPGLRRG